MLSRPPERHRQTDPIPLEQAKRSWSELQGALVAVHRLARSSRQLGVVPRLPVLVAGHPRPLPDTVAEHVLAQTTIRHPSRLHADIRRLRSEDGGDPREAESGGGNRGLCHTRGSLPHPNDH